MSTYLYLECLDHDPVISSYWQGEVGQHLSDLKNVRGYIANRDALLKAHELDCDPSETWARTATYFFAMHPKCNIGIRDEYGAAYPVSEDAQAVTDGLLSELARYLPPLGYTGTNRDWTLSGGGLTFTHPETYDEIVGTERFKYQPINYSVGE